MPVVIKRNAYQDGCRKTNRHGGGSFGRAYPERLKIA